MSSQLAPISYASSIVGFTSFTLTVFIWVHAFWNGFLTILSAPQEIPDAFSTLRQGLYEEREYLKRVRRRREGPSHTPASKSLYYEGGPTKVLSVALKDLIHSFKSYEAPFLLSPHDGREKELEWSFDATQQAYRCDLWHRVLWLRSKGGVERIATQLERMQIRRVAVEVTETRWMVGDCMGLVRECEGRLGAIEERLQMSRIG